MESLSVARSSRKVRRGRYSQGGVGLVLAPSLLALVPALFGGQAERPTPDQLFLDLRAKYKQDDKKYDALVTKVDKAVRKALASTALPGDTDPGRHLDRHPFVTLVNELSAAAKTGAGKASAAATAFVTSYPWSSQLELAEGLQYGSDRPIPPHESGFIRLGNLPEPAPGFPELLVNQYLFGLHEIAGWQSGVEQKTPLAFRGRTPRAPPPAMARALPTWEALRLYLQGVLPEVALFAIPELTHRIHARLAERRRSADGKAAPMDELLALLDAHWNGFFFQSPNSKIRTAFVVPVSALIADRRGFVYRFAEGEHYGGTGDIPFVSVLTLQSYAKAMRSEQFTPRDFIAKEAGASAATQAFWQDCVYLGRYRALVDLFVRALLAPGHPLPAYLESFEYPGTKMPDERSTARALEDVGRKHALLLWAFVGNDPVALADFLHENLLDLEVNRFPKNTSLERELAYLGKKREAELLAAIQSRLTKERDPAGKPGDLEREFSPHATYLDPASEAATGYLVHSFHSFHAPLARAIRDAAYEVLLAELGK